MPADRDATVLSITNLTVAFRQEAAWNTVVHSLKVSLAKGKILGIVGESGSGKSVSCLAVMGLLPSHTSKVSGAVTLRLGDREIDFLSLSEQERRIHRGKEIAMIFQEPMTSLNPVYTCGEQVSEAIRLHKAEGKREAARRTLALFEEVQLPAPQRMYSSYPHQLSGGQKQRVMIAMALSCDPCILIADEPTTALDVTVQRTIIDLLKRLQQERHMSMVFISHDLGIVSELADDVLVMLRGNVVEQGTAHEVFRYPQHPYTRGLLACRPSNNQGLRRLPVISDFMDDSEGGIVARASTIESVRSRLALAPGEAAKREDILYSREPILVATGLSKIFTSRSFFATARKGGVKAVDDVSFVVYRGETLGLVGESGSGKTTLGRSILRLVEPDSGSLFYGGRDLLKLNATDLRLMRRTMQIIFQDPYSSLNPRQTVGETITEPMKIHSLFNTNNQRKEKAFELLTRVNLKPEWFNRYPHEFSGGQRQRIGIARALAVNPEFIICDESVSALDVSVQAQVINLLVSLREEFNLTFIFISHDLSVVRFISDRIMVMNKGRIEEQGTPDEIYGNPKSSYTRKLIDAIPKGMVN